MSGTEIQVPLRVFLSPDPAAKPTTWLCRGVSVRVTKESGGTVGEPRTDADGVTSEVTLTEETSYRVELTEPAWPGAWGAGQLRTGKRSERHDVWLYPLPEYRHFVLRLITDSGAPVAGGTVVVTAAPGFNQPFNADSHGYVNAVAPSASDSVMLELRSTDVGGAWFCPRDSLVPYTVPAPKDVTALDFVYWPAIQIEAKPTVTMEGTESPLPGTEVTVDYRVSDQDTGTSRTKTLTAGTTVISFEYPFPGEYRVAVEPPSTWSDLPIEPVPERTAGRSLTPGQWTPLKAGAPWTVPASFAVVPNDEATIRVTTPDDQPLAGNPQFKVSYGTAGTTVTVDAVTGAGTATVPKDIPSTISLEPGSAKLERRTPGPAGTIEIPLKMATPGQAVVRGANEIVLEYEYPLTVKARDAQDRPVAGAIIDIFDRQKNLVGDGVTDSDGNFVIGVGERGTYYASQHSMGGYPAILESGQVRSPGEVTVRIKDRDGEGLTDLSAYPVLTEEISTTGPPAPSPGAGGGGAGSGYGQTVEQVIRDVLGWRPGGDVAGFQAALTGAFQLREVEGHTEWSWQQRGYAVQADMGALTGAQASIYARAKSALDQILPLLAGLTPINPALYPPQDLEAIRTVISTELQELVNELGLEGGPRIQRVDELFGLLLGDKVGSKQLNPDVVQGQLGILRTRFGLTVDEIETIEEERIVTNFRIIVEQVLALQASWSTDRGLLSPLDPRASFGTVLIWLSRSLEAVCESVGDVTFAMDSVFVDAAQRQVVDLNLPGEPALLLSDLLDWVLRASRDEGPRIIQDAGKDGVLAFAPVLRRLHGLVRQTRNAVRKDHSLPDGLRTPRVQRALAVLADQLEEAAQLAGQVRRDEAPQITGVLVQDPNAKILTVDLTGNNFRRGASALLIPEDRDDLPDVTSRSVNVFPPSDAIATFRNPRKAAGEAETSWLVMLVNPDGTQSNEAEALTPHMPVR